jgi:hypothetical protein
MTNSVSEQLLAAIAELQSIFPDWRMGQLIANLTQAAGRDSDGAIWDVEDDELLAAARRLIDGNRHRRASSGEPSVAPDRSGAPAVPVPPQPPRQVR